MDLVFLWGEKVLLYITFDKETKWSCIINTNLLGSQVFIISKSDFYIKLGELQIPKLIDQEL